MINFSELQWKPQGPGRRAGAATPMSPPREDPQLRAVPSIEAKLSPGCRIALQGEASLSADRFRYLRMRLREVRELASLSTLLVTSPLAQDGKSTIILNLATTLAEGGKKSVLVIEGDLHRPSLAQKLGLDGNARLNDNGLAQCLDGDRDPFSLLWKIQPLNWYILPAGKTKENPTELMQQDRIGEIISRLTPHFDWILVDSPPVLPLTDAMAMSKYVDACLLVVRAHQTPKEGVEQALTILGKKHVLGVLFNAHEGVNKSYAKYGSYYAQK